MNQFGIKVRWSGREARLWKSVVDELKKAERKTSKNDQLTLTMCVNYGGRAEIADAMTEIAQDVKDRKLKPSAITEKKIKKYLYEPTLPYVDLFLRTSGEQRTSNFLLWQSAYAEMVFMDVLWPDFDRRHLWQAIEIYAKRERRFGDAKPN
jgi:undecaprenyl diphosphate synthase